MAARSARACSHGRAVLQQRVQWGGAAPIGGFAAKRVRSMDLACMGPPCAHGGRPLWDGARARRRARGTRVAARLTPYRRACAREGTMLS